MCLVCADVLKVSDIARLMDTSGIQVCLPPDSPRCAVPCGQLPARFPTYVTFCRRPFLTAHGLCRCASLCSTDVAALRWRRRTR